MDLLCPVGGHPAAGSCDGVRVSRTLELPPAGQDRLERFFRAHTGDAGLRLPRLVFDAGAAAAWATRRLDAAAVTLGRRVLVAPWVVSGEEGGLSAPADLIVHEAAHVLQYRSHGVLRFLAAYAAGYLAGLWRLGRVDAGARQAAYLDIPAERAARAAAAAYREWAARHGDEDARLTVCVRA